MSDSARQLAQINARFVELIPGLSASLAQNSAQLAPCFDQIRDLLEQARKLTASGRLHLAHDERTREILADYRRHLITLRDTIGRIEPLLTARRAELHRQLDHIRHASSWACSVRDAR